MGACALSRRRLLGGNWPTSRTGSKAWPLISDGWSELAYQHGDRWTILDRKGHRRLVMALGREGLLGLQPGHTLPTVARSALSSQPAVSKRTRRAELVPVRIGSLAAGTVPVSSRSGE